MFKLFLFPLLALCSANFLFGASYYPERPDDAKAVDLSPANFSVHGDGKADDTEAIQQAIDKEEETNSEGYSVIRPARYRHTKRIHNWPGTRIARQCGTRHGAAVRPT